MKTLCLAFLLLLPFSVNAATGGIFGDSSISVLDDSGAVSTTNAYLNVDFKFVADSNDVGDYLYMWGWSSSTGSVKLAYYNLKDADTTMIGSAGTVNVSSATHQYYGVDMDVPLPQGDTIVIGIGDPSGSIGSRYGTITGGTSLNAGDSLPETWVELTTNNRSIHMYSVITNSSAGAAVSDTVDPGDCVTIEWANVPTAPACQEQRMSDGLTTTRRDETGTNGDLMEYDDWGVPPSLITLDSVATLCYGTSAGLGCPCSRSRPAIVIGSDTTFGNYWGTDAYTWNRQILEHPRKQAYSLADASLISGMFQYDDNGTAGVDFRMAEFHIIYYGDDGSGEGGAAGWIMIIGQRGEVLWQRLRFGLRLD